VADDTESGIAEGDDALRGASPNVIQQPRNMAFQGKSNDVRLFGVREKVRIRERVVPMGKGSGEFPVGVLDPSGVVLARVVQVDAVGDPGVGSLDAQ
jgi:hypothetical protein